MGNILQEEMFRVFNMGIGMTVIISPASLEEFKSSAQKMSEDIILLGEVAAGTGKVQIK